MTEELYQKIQEKIAKVSSSKTASREYKKGFSVAANQIVQLIVKLEPKESK